MKMKLIPALITLIAGFITCIVSFLNQVSMAVFAKNLCLVVIIFLVLGNIIRFIMERNFREPEEEQEEEEAPEGTEETEETEKDAQSEETDWSKEKEIQEEQQ